MQELKNKNHTGETKMIIPVRCYSCGKPIGHLWEGYKERVSNVEERQKIIKMRLRETDGLIKPVYVDARTAS